MDKLPVDEFVGRIAKGAEVSLGQARTMMENVFGALAEVLCEGDAVGVPDFGTFRVHTAPAHEARNPRSGDSVQVPERAHPKFEASSVLKRRMNGAS